MEQTPPKRTRPLADERDAEQQAAAALQIARAQPLPVPRIEGAPVPNPSLPSNLWNVALTPSPVIRRYQNFRGGVVETPPRKKAAAPAPVPEFPGGIPETPPRIQSAAPAPVPEPEPEPRSPSWSSGTTLAFSPNAGVVYQLRRQARAKPKAKPQAKLQAHPKTKNLASKPNATVKTKTKHASQEAAASSSSTAARVPSLDAADGARLEGAYENDEEE